MLYAIKFNENLDCVEIKAFVSISGKLIRCSHEPAYFRHLHTVMNVSLLPNYRSRSYRILSFWEGKSTDSSRGLTFSLSLLQSAWIGTTCFKIPTDGVTAVILQDRLCHYDTHSFPG